MKKKQRTILFSLLIFILTIFLSAYGAFYAPTVEALTEPEYVSGTMYNNVFLLKFMEDEHDFTDSVGTDISGASTKYDVLSNTYNTGLYSLNGYYDAMSNGKLNLVSNIITNNGSAFEIPFKRGQMCTYSTSNTIGYTDDTYSQMYYNLYLKILDLIIDSIPSNIDLDLNNDNEVDCLTFVIIDSDNTAYEPEWSDILWPHQSNIDRYQKSVTNVDGSQLLLSTYNLFIFELPDSTSDYKTINNVSTPKTVLSTICHEMGHVLGLPDYYSYDSSTASPQTAMGVWDIMAVSSGPQTMTAYTRYRMGWIDDSQIADVKLNGSYSLKALTYEINQYANGSLSNPYMGDRIVAYRLSHPDYPNQYMYIEMRSQYMAMEVSSASYGTGLLVYRVDENVLDKRGIASDVNVTNGNWYDEPYGIYVFRNTITFDDTSMTSLNDSVSLQFAPLTKSLTQNSSYENTIFGDTSYVSDYATFTLTSNKDTTYTTKVYGTALTWQTYDTSLSQQQLIASDVTYIDSGIVIKLDELTREDATFTIEWENLEDVISKEDFGNDTLYDAILTKYNLTYLKKNYWNELGYLDLTNLGISDFTGLSKLNYSSVNLINLSDNNITDISEILSIVQNNSSVKIVLLNNNKINLSALTAETLTNEKILYGVQNVAVNKVNIDQSVSLSMHFGVSTDLVAYSVKCNGVAETLDSSKPTHEFAGYGQHIVSVSTSTSLGAYSYTLSFYTISVQFSSVHIEKNYSITDTMFYNAMTVKGVNKSSIGITINLSASTSTPQSGSTNIVCKFDGVEFNVACSYEISDTEAPTPILSLSTKRILLGETNFRETNIQFTDNKETKSYTFVDSITEDMTSCYTHYVTDTSNNIIPNFSADKVGTFYVHYIAKDEYGNTSNGSVYQILIIEDKSAPVITLNGGSVIYVNCNTEYKEYGATVIDNYDQDLEYKIDTKLSDTVDTTVAKEYSLVYYAEDSSGNRSDSITRKVVVQQNDFNVFDSENTAVVSTVHTLKFSLSMFDIGLDSEENVTYLWYNNGELYNRTSIPTINIPFNDSGTYSISLKVAKLVTDPTTGTTSYEYIDSDVSYTVVVESQYTIALIIVLAIIILVVLLIIANIVKKIIRKKSPNKPE